MARIRSLKPEFFQNAGLCRLDPLTRILFQGLWCFADREGRLEDNPEQIQMTILPMDDCDVDGMLQQLADSRTTHRPNGFITRYRVNGIPYIQVNGFEQHQRPNAKEAPSTIPPPNLQDAPEGAEHEKNRADTKKIVPTRKGISLKGREGKGKEGVGKGKGGEVAVDAAAALDDLNPFAETAEREPDPVFDAYQRVINVDNNAGTARSIIDLLTEFTDEPDLMGQLWAWNEKFGGDRETSKGRLGSMRKWLENLRVDRDRPSKRSHLQAVRPQKPPPNEWAPLQPSHCEPWDAARKYAREQAYHRAGEGWDDATTTDIGPLTTVHQDGLMLTVQCVNAEHAAHLEREIWGKWLRQGLRSLRGGPFEVRFTAPMEVAS